MRRRVGFSLAVVAGFALANLTTNISTGTAEPSADDSTYLALSGTGPIDLSELDAVIRNGHGSGLTAAETVDQWVEANRPAEGAKDPTIDGLPLSLVEDIAQLSRERGWSIQEALQDYGPQAAYQEASDSFELSPR